MTVAVLLLTWLAGLGGCGPTGGGTGTGESVLVPADFGARAASACSAPFASALVCATVATAPVDTAALPGSAKAEFSGRAASGPFTLTVQGNRAELMSRCQAGRFEGEWGVLPNGDGRFFGTWTGPDGGSPQPASLWVQISADAVGGLQVLVQDQAGRTLFGPLQLRPGATAAPTSCP